MTEDSQQISVSELLKRNGQQVESRGGRRRRGVKGGISVAELTGEIPVVRDPSDSRALDPEPEPEPEPAAPEPPRASAPSAPSARADERTAAFKAPVDDDDDDEPIASRPAGRGRGVVAGGTSRDHQGTWVSRSVQKERPAPEAAAPAPAPTVAAPAVKKAEPAPAVAAPRVKPAPKTDTPAAETAPAAKSEAPAKPAVPAKPEAPAKPGTPATAGAAAPSNGASKFVKTPKPEASAKAKPEPALLSGSTLAGDLMRQSRDSEAANAGEETELIEAATDDADTEKHEGDTQKPESPRRSRKEAKAEKAEAAKAEKAGKKDEAGENSTREWAVLIGQGVVAVIAGALLFKGFEKLWDVFPWVALILALLVIVGLVAMVRILRRTDDITSFVIAVVVGMIVTLGPLAFMLASG
ncbi:hypothetical protein [Rhodococcus sp. IEGM 1305]|uniref:hypothetical protein n=1 Tax=Rhodococcus sp. IEGM 1305 TaxID=3047092 RepID=UPI0024B6A815|nr:hypothetical protein [Rhodococcus sp. IEGM 1305]MDI9950672.1 hypothetical protein [Rhodococcus sp. IEGM 1305]